MPTILEQWLYAIPIAFMAFYASRFRWWLGLFALVWPILLIMGGKNLYFHDFVCESYLYDNSQIYFSSIILSALFVVLATCHGIRVGLKRARQDQKPIT